MGCYVCTSQSRSTRRWREGAERVKFPKVVSSGAGSLAASARHGRALSIVFTPFQHDSSLSLTCSVSLFSSNPMPAIIAPSPRLPPQHIQLLTQDSPHCNPLSSHPQHPRTYLSPPRLLSPIRLHDPPYVALVCPAHFASTPSLTRPPTEYQITHPMWSTPQETCTVSAPCSFYQAPSSSTTCRLPSRCLWASIHIRSTPLDLGP